MSIIRHRDLPENVTYLTRGTVRRVETGETGAKSCTLWEQELPPEGYIPLHYHEVEEVMTFLSGRVEVTVGEETAELEADTTLFIPDHVVHSIRNSGAEPVRGSPGGQ